jgi:hypothetical protein
LFWRSGLIKSIDFPLWYMLVDVGCKTASICA